LKEEYSVLEGRISGSGRKNIRFLKEEYSVVEGRIIGS